MQTRLFLPKHKTKLAFLHFFSSSLKNSPNGFTISSWYAVLEPPVMQLVGFENDALSIKIFLIFQILFHYFCAFSSMESLFRNFNNVWVLQRGLLIKNSKPANKGSHGFVFEVERLKVFAFCWGLQTEQECFFVPLLIDNRNVSSNFRLPADRSNDSEERFCLFCSKILWQLFESYTQMSIPRSLKVLCSIFSRHRCKSVTIFLAKVLRKTLWHLWDFYYLFLQEMYIKFSLSTNIT